MLESLINKVAGMKTCRPETSFINERLQHSCFLVNIANFQRTAFYRTHLVVAFTLSMANYEV